MKKLAVVVMIIALATFMAAMASADGNHYWRGIHGDYAMTGTGNCLWSPNPFTPIDPPTSPPEDMTDLMTAYRADLTYSGHFSVQGLLVFRVDGTGSAEFTHFGIGAPPVLGAPTGTFGVSASLKFHLAFEYHVNSDGTITIAATMPGPGEFQGYFASGPNTGQRFTVEPFTFSGFISADHKTLTLTTKNEQQRYVVSNVNGTFNRYSYGVCNSGRVLIRVSDQDDD